MTDYERMVERDRRFWRRVRIVWWLAVIVLGLCVVIVYVWK